MPIPGTQLAQILSDRITALGAVPVTTDLQADVAENLLWQQLLALLGGESANLSIFANPTGTAAVVNTAVLTDFPIVDAIALDADNFPIGSVCTVELKGSFNNGSGGPVAYELGTAFGSSPGILFPFVTVAAGDIRNFSGSLQFVRNAAGFFIGMGGCLCIDGLVSSVAFGTPPLAFADGDTVRPAVIMDTADPAVLATLFSRTIEVQTFVDSQLIF